MWPVGGKTFVIYIDKKQDIVTTLYNFSTRLSEFKGKKSIFVCMKIMLLLCILQC